MRQLQGTLTLKLDVALWLDVVALLVLFERRNHRDVRKLICLLASLLVLRLYAQVTSRTRTNTRRVNYTCPVCLSSGQMRGACAAVARLQRDGR